MEEKIEVWLTLPNKSEPVLKKFTATQFNVLKNLTKSQEALKTALLQAVETLQETNKNKDAD